ncbi:hypothetical protein LEMLEM_LOCUS1951 [Lemmus lemmus]
MSTLEILKAASVLEPYIVKTHIGRTAACRCEDGGNDCADCFPRQVHRPVHSSCGSLVSLGGKAEVEKLTSYARGCQSVLKSF